LNTCASSYSNSEITNISKIIDTPITKTYTKTIKKSNTKITESLIGVTNKTNFNKTFKFKKLNNKFLVDRFISDENTIKSKLTKAIISRAYNFKSKSNEKMSSKPKTTQKNKECNQKIHTPLLQQKFSNSLFIRN